MTWPTTRPAPVRGKAGRGKGATGEFPAGALALAGETFVAIDFETADYGRDSACAVALVRVERDRIVSHASRLIRPPRRYFVFTYLHGIAWADVASEPCFGDVWPDLQPMLSGADFLVAHNAPFDRGVLAACCGAAGLPMPDLPIECSVRWARHTWGLRRASLDVVCARLGIPLNHHHALSDAEACARIMLAVRGEWRRRDEGR
jgi:DNA polymerase-3 subunit epsilon